MARLSLRLLGLILLTFSVGVSSCQAVFPLAPERGAPQLPPGYQEGKPR